MAPNLGAELQKMMLTSAVKHRVNGGEAGQVLGVNDERLGTVMGLWTAPDCHTGHCSNGTSASCQMKLMMRNGTPLNGEAKTVDRGTARVVHQPKELPEQDH